MITEITQGQELPDLLQGADIFTNLSQGQITHAYKIDRYLEEGAFGSVRLVTHRQTGIKRVMKQIRKDKISKEDEIRMLTQVNILYQLDHPNIVKLYELFQDSKYYYLIMEYLEGGELFDKITQLHNLSEGMVADYMKQIFSAVMYCHGKQIVHRDLKPENILFANKKNGANIKIIGFGTSRDLFGEQKITQKLPPPYYMAPEILIKNYTEKSDLWSCGIILHILLSGCPPFGGQESEIVHKIQSGNLEFNLEDWGHVSNEAKDFIRNLLTVDYQKRISAHQAYHDAWICNAPATQLNEKVMKNIQSFHAKNKLRAAITHFIAALVLKNSERSNLQRMLKQIDKNGNRQLSKDELIEVYTEQYDEIKARKIVDDIFAYVDINNSGLVDYFEFSAAAFDRQKYLINLNLSPLLKCLILQNKSLIQNEDRQISQQELADIMGGEIQDNQWQNILSNCESQNDDQISQEDFLQFMLNKYI